MTRLITGALVAEDLPVDTFGDLSQEELVVAKTADRRVLGCMNDLAFLCEETAARSDGLRHLDVAALNASMHRLIHSTRDYVPPIDALRARIGGES